MTTRRKLLSSAGALFLTAAAGDAVAQGIRVRLGTTGVSAATQKAMLTSGNHIAVTVSSQSIYSAWNGSSGATNNTAAVAPKWRGVGGTVTLLRIQVATNTRATASVLTFMKNGAAGGTPITISIGAGVTGALTEAVPGSVSLSDGDLYNAELALGSGGGNLIYQASCQVAIAGQAFVQLAQSSSTNAQAQGVTNFALQCGNSGGTGTEGNAQLVTLETCTDDQMQVYITANTLSGTCVFTYRKAGVDQTLTLTVGAGLTGFFEDAVNSVSLAADDLTSVKIVTAAGTGSITWQMLSVRRTGAVASRISLYSQAGTTGAAGSVQRFNAFGGRTSSLTTEAEFQLPAAFAAQMTRLTARCTANTTTVGSNVRIRVNGASVTNVAAMPAATANAIAKDTTNTDIIAAGDLIDIFSPAPTGSLNWECYGALMTAT